MQHMQAQINNQHCLHRRDYFQMRQNLPFFGHISDNKKTCLQKIVKYWIEWHQCQQRYLTRAEFTSSCLSDTPHVQSKCTPHQLGSLREPSLNSADKGFFSAEQTSLKKKNNFNHQKRESRNKSPPLISFFHCVLQLLRNNRSVSSRCPFLVFAMAIQSHVKSAIVRAQRPHTRGCVTDEPKEERGVICCFP